MAEANAATIVTTGTGTGDQGPDDDRRRREAETGNRGPNGQRPQRREPAAGDRTANGHKGGNRQRPSWLLFQPPGGECYLATGFQPVDRRPRRLLFFFCPSPGGAPERRSTAPQRGWGIRKQGWCDARLPRVENPWLEYTRALRHWQSGATNVMRSRHHGPERAGLAACYRARQQHVVQDRAIEYCVPETPKNSFVALKPSWASTEVGCTTCPSGTWSDSDQG